jgi:hypothetical protein
MLNAVRLLDLSLHHVTVTTAGVDDLKGARGVCKACSSLNESIDHTFQSEMVNGDVQQDGRGPKQKHCWWYEQCAAEPVHVAALCI